MFVMITKMKYFIRTLLVLLPPTYMGYGPMAQLCGHMRALRCLAEAGEARRAEGVELLLCIYPLHAALTTHHALQPLPLGRHGRCPLPPPRRGPVLPPTRLPFHAVGGPGAPPSTPLRASHRRRARAPGAPADFEARQPAGRGDAGAPAAV